MVNKQIERDEVLKPCLKLCKRLKQQGYILKYRRLDALDMWHESGDPDIEIFFLNDGLLWILMCECKAPNGKLSAMQVFCMNKYKNIRNVIYQEVRRVEELEKTLNEMAENINFNPESLKEFMENKL